VTKAILLYRIASLLFVVFAAGHTVGFLTFKPLSPEGLAVRDAMQTVHFQVKGASFTYADFYTGFGLYATVYLLFSAFLAWYLGKLARTTPQAIGSLAWVFVAVQVASLILSWRYFLLPPVILSALLVVCLGLAGWLLKTSQAQKPAESQLRNATS
jgi:hypothetical protein